MTAVEVASLLTAVGVLLGAFVAYRKLSPERNDITITSADRVNQMTLRFAGEVGQDNEDLRAKVDRLEAELAAFREDTQTHISELNSQLRGKVAEVKHLESEVARRDAQIAERDEQITVRDQQIEDLRDRVDHLETEVRQLKANGS